MTRLVSHHIDGAPLDVLPDETQDVHDPTTGATVARVALGDAGDVDRAVRSALSAFERWRQTTVVARQRIMFAFRERLEREAERLARLITEEHGKTLEDARGEIGRGIEVVDFLCGAPDLLKGEFSGQVSTDVDITSMRQPLGVCAGITPFNFPVMVPLWMMPVAVAAGNTFILKPSEQDPSPSVVLAELLLDAGAPAGVCNVVQGDRRTVDALLAHPDVAAVSFVGSTPVARHIYATAAANGKRVQALGGAKNHMVVLPDADLDAAADAAVSAAYGSAGERCMAISVVVAVGDASDELVGRLKERVSSLRVGPGTDPGSDMGPLISAAHRDRVASYVEDGVAAGAELVVDGRGVTPAGHEQGFFLGPCLFDRVTPDMRIYAEEIFGPVLCVVRAGTLAEAIDLVNANPYGNGASIFTDSGTAARLFQQEVTAGMVGVNLPIPVPLAFFSFGGWKQSLFGDCHIYGREGLRFYTRGKVVTSRWRARASSALEMGFSPPS